MPLKLKSNGGKKRIQRSVVGKYKIASKISNDPGPEQNKNGFKKQNLKVAQSFYSKLGQKCFEILYRGTQFFHLAPFKRTMHGRFAQRFRIFSGCEKIQYYTALTLGLALATQNFVGSVEMVLREELKVETFMCVGLFLTYFVALMIGLGIWAQPEETMDILNNWEDILGCL